MKTLNLMAAVFVVGLFITGCASVTGQKNEKSFQNYRAELDFEFAGKTYEGFLVTKIGPEGFIDLVIHAPITLNRVEISTCSRHEVIRNTASGWFDKVSSDMRYRYVPTKAESAGSCPLFVQVFNDHVQKAWGMVNFRTDQDLPAHMDCNGRGISFAGVSACGTKAGLEEQLTFAKRVEFEAQPSCKITTSDNMVFNVRNSAVGFCKATFSDGAKFHDLILHGYDEVTVY